MNNNNFGNPIFSKDNIKDIPYPYPISFAETEDNKYAIYFEHRGYINIEHYKKAQKALNDFFDDYDINKIEKNNKRAIKEYERRMIIQELTNMLLPSKKYNKYEGYIYIIKSKEYYKIGRSKNSKNRIKIYKTENPNKIETIICQKVNNYVEIEKKLHNLFKDKKYRGEWFLLNKDDINIIKKCLNK